MWIKICATTSLEDAQLAAELGASAVGFVFAPSPRRVTPTEVRGIARHLPATVERIGVFVTGDAQEIVRAVGEAELTGAQLHGEFNLPLVEELQRRFGSQTRIVQTLHWRTAADAAETAALIKGSLKSLREHTSVDRVLLDTKVGSSSGGLGIAFNWAAAADLLREDLGRFKLILAGGLNPENVAEAIETLKPWGVDVASGVEESPGRKLAQRVEAFITKASQSFPLSTERSS